MLESLLILYYLVLIFIFFYNLIQAHLILKYLFKSKKNTEPDKRLEIFPIVTVQLPVYNELYVVERLIDTICTFSYPKDKLEVQVLDDSTDETIEIIASKVLEWQAKGIDISHIRRPERKGFKAGALEYGLQRAKGEYIAIFDADFVPDTDFLLKTLPTFKEDKKIGMVQTRWGHLNKGYSLLTRLQAFGLDGHFVVEQTGRNAGGFFINFNGTGGIWKKDCIIDSGGWHYDTLTEDLDLSYRSQLKGWKFRYLENFVSPAELPPIMTALKSQQYRWTKGAAETARKHLIKVIVNPEISFSVKTHAVFHLLNSALFICIFLSSLLSLPLLIFSEHLDEYKTYLSYGSIFLLSFVILATTYWIGYSKDETRKTKAFLNFLKDLPLFFSISMGLSLHNAIAVAEGYMGKKTPFIRTPKFNLSGKNNEWKENKYLTKSLNLGTVAEGFMAIYFLSGIFIAFIKGNYGVLPYHIMLTIGFAVVFYYSVFHSPKKIKL